MPNTETICWRFLIDIAITKISIPCVIISKPAITFSYDLTRPSSVVMGATLQYFKSNAVLKVVSKLVVIMGHFCSRNLCPILAMVESGPHTSSLFHFNIDEAMFDFIPLVNTTLILLFEIFDKISSIKSESSVLFVRIPLLFNSLSAIFGLSLIRSE